MGCLDSGQLANGLVQQEAGSGHQILGAVEEIFTCACSV